MHLDFVGGELGFRISFRYDRRMGTSMNIAISGKLEKFVKSKIQSGQYANAAQVVQRALYLLREDDLYRAPDGSDLRTAVARGMEDVKRGDVGDWDSKEIIALGRKLLAASRAKNGSKRKSA
jgi:antitoxin ParD1/3/4